MTLFFLAQLLGLYLLIAGLFVLSKGPFVQKALVELKGSPLIMTMSGLLRLLFGLFLVLFYPMAVMNWSLLIPIIGYLLIISGIIRLFFPTYFIKILGKIKLPHLTYFGIILLIIGLLLIYQGFFVRM